MANFSSPTLETLREIFECYEAGEVEVAEVIDTIDEVSEHVNDYFDELEAQGEAGEVDTQDEGYKMVAQGFEEHLVGLELLSEALDGPPEGLEEGLARVQKAVNLMIAGRRLLVAKDQAPQTVSCLFCGQENAPGSSRCGSCSRQLPMTGNQPMGQSSISVKEEVETGEEVMTQEYVSLSESVEAWKEGEASGDDFCRVLDEVAQALDKQLKANKGIARQLERFGEQARSQGDRIAKRSNEALQRSGEILDDVYKAYEDDDDVHLDSAVHDFYLQSKILVECHGELTRLEQSVGQ